MDGNGTYKVTVLENVTDKKYAVELSTSVSVTLKDKFAPFLRPNQYVDFTNASKTIAKAAELAKGVANPLVKVEKIYDFVVNTLTYDIAKAQAVKIGYLPVLDDVLAAKKGTCRGSGKMEKMTSCPECRDGKTGDGNDCVTCQGTGTVAA